MPSNDVSKNFARASYRYSKVKSAFWASDIYHFAVAFVVKSGHHM